MLIVSHLYPSVPIRFPLLTRRFLSAASPSMSRTPLETEDDDKPYVHYNHTIPSKHPRWTPRECFQYFYDRPWDEIRDFYADAVRRVILFGKKGMFRRGAKIVGRRVSWKTRGPEDGRGGIIRSWFRTMGLLSTWKSLLGYLWTRGKLSCSRKSLYLWKDVLLLLAVLIKELQLCGQSVHFIHGGRMLNPEKLKLP